MKIQLFSTLRNYKTEYLKKDIFAGIVVAAMTVPIAMGYAEIAGLPAVYGLYASVLPILVFALFSTSPQFIFGVDAAPAAIAGSFLTAMGIAKGSEEALAVMPVLTLLTGLWLFLFFFLHAEKILGYISTPVMGGFISGIAVTIILMQVPKLLGSAPGEGELLQLLLCIVNAGNSFHGLSFILGIVTLIFILFLKKIAPKVPAAILVMIAGALGEYFFDLGSYGVKMLEPVDSGMINISMPVLTNMKISEYFSTSITIAVVIMAESLLAEKRFAAKNGYQLKERQELLAFATANLAGAICGNCPVNGSVSRTSIAEQYSGKTQMTSIIAGMLMCLILMFGSGLIRYLPIPIMTAIVISALMSVIEKDLAKRLRKVSRMEYAIFLAAFFGVLLFGTIFGVVIGTVLSFVSVVLRAARPAREFLGVIPGHEGFYNLKRSVHAYKIRRTIIYKFNGNLFFANSGIFVGDLERELSRNPDTDCVIVDASGISSIDITAADEIRRFDEKLRKRKVRFYLTEHTAYVNDELRRYGLADLIEKGMVRRTLTVALQEAGREAPYQLEGLDENEITFTKLTSPEELHSLQEYLWAFGKDAAKQMEKNIEKILTSDALDSLESVTDQPLIRLAKNWHQLSAFDEDELLKRLELHLSELAVKLGVTEEEALGYVERHRNYLKQRLENLNPDIPPLLEAYEKKLEKRLNSEQPENYEKLKNIKKRYYEHFKEDD